jgi:hypothetical protein
MRFRRNHPVGMLQRKIIFDSMEQARNLPCLISTILLERSRQ